MKYIENGWQAYRRMAVASNAPAEQVNELKQAYFSGAAVLFKGMLMILDDGQEPTDSDMAKMALINQEIEEFGQTLDKKIFGAETH